MPLKSGFGYAVVRENIAELHRAGKAWASAVAIAYANARVSFFRAHSRGALPEWLAYPKGYRLREHYDAHGKPAPAGRHSAELQSLEKAVRSTPNPRKIAQAAQLFEDFTGKRAKHITKHELPELPTEGLVFGRLLQVGYESARDGRPYRHTFRERSRPLLVATPDGKTVYIVCGRYAFTDRGIVDK